MIFLSVQRVFVVGTCRVVWGMVGRGGRGSPRHIPGDLQGKGCMLTLAICVSISTQISQLQASMIERFAGVLISWISARSIARLPKWPRELAGRIRLLQASTEYCSSTLRR
jgi:hypothetical protein